MPSLKMLLHPCILMYEIVDIIEDYLCHDGATCCIMYVMTCQVLYYYLMA